MFHRECFISDTLPERSIAMDKRKVIATVTVVLVLIAACVIFIPIKREINQDFTCYACHQDDPAYREEVTVNFTGTYVDYLFLTDRFEGYIDVSDFAYLNEDFLPDNARPLELNLSEVPDLVNYMVYSKPGIAHYSIEIRASLQAAEDLSAFRLGYFVPDTVGNGSRIMKVVLSYPEWQSWEETLSSSYPG